MSSAGAHCTNLNAQRKAACHSSQATPPRLQLEGKAARTRYNSSPSFTRTFTLLYMWPGSGAEHAVGGAADRWSSGGFRIRRPSLCKLIRGQTE